MEKENRQIQKYDVLCVGLALGNVLVRPVPERFTGDTVQVEEIAVKCGGDAYNQASVLSAMGDKVALISKIGKDASGELVYTTMAKRGVDTSFITVDPDIGTSNSIVMIKENGQRNFYTFKGCLRNFGEEDINFEILSESKVVSIGGLFSLPSFDQGVSNKLFMEAKKRGCITVADTKYDAFHIGLKGIGNLLEYTDYFFPSYEEASYLSGMEEPKEIAHFFAKKGATHVGIKLGEKGCYLCSKEYEGIVPSFESCVLDTTGAGDNFMAGLIHGIVKGWDIRDSVVYANAAGAVAVSHLGATNEAPYFPAIEKMLEKTVSGKKLLEERILR